jgi:hypothetical protein
MRDREIQREREREREREKEREREREREREKERERKGERERELVKFCLYCRTSFLWSTSFGFNLSRRRFCKTFHRLNRSNASSKTRQNATE